MMRAALPVVALALLAGGCSRSGDTSFFPLEAGRRWTYDVRTERADLPLERETRVLAATGRASVDGLEGGPAFHRRSDDGVDYWLRADETGIYRVASKSELEAAPQPDRERRYVLKQPLAVGTTWRSTTTAYLLQRRQEFPREIRHAHPSVPMTYTIEAVGEPVQVAAGAWSGCVRVRGVAALRLFADPVVGWKDLPLTTLEWYCPGAGLVKLEREEPANSTFLVGGKLTMELVELD